MLNYIHNHAHSSVQTSKNRTRGLPFFVKIKPANGPLMSNFTSGTNIIEMPKLLIGLPGDGTNFILYVLRLGPNVSNTYLID
jgi:hypothetical protein